MQLFKDSAAPSKIYGYDDDVVVTIENGVSTVQDARGEKVSAPTTLVPATEADLEPPEPSLSERAILAMLAGLSISLTGSITIAETTFPTDPDTQTKIAAVITTLNATGTFPGGGTSYPLKDTTGSWHTFTVDQYKAVAAAIAAYVAALHLIIDGNPLNAAGLPDSTVALTV